MKRDKLKGKISISRRHGRGDTIGIELVDELSGTRFAEIEMTPEAFGCAITGLSLQPCEFEFRPKYVGLVREHKTEDVEFRVSDYATDALKPYEVDGWIGYVDDALNHHRQVGTNKYRVGFVRYVQPIKS